MADTDFVSPQENRTTRRHRLIAFLTSNRFLIYVCCFITSWGDRMWRFAIGVYMIALYPKTLKLTATYGFVHSGASLLFGAVIGDMIDRTQRLKAVRVALLLRNLSIFCCSAYVFFVFLFWKDVKDTIFLEVSKGIIIFLAVVAHLASMANNITVTKDWAVVICGTNKETLMEMSAFFRRIDLVCKILAPIVVGQIMSFASNTASAIFICCENIVTLIVMYALLRIIYRRVPRLAIKEKKEKLENGEEGDQTPTAKPRHRWINRICFTCISFGKGWSCYVRQSVAAAGFSLAMMYMTVLGFDNITVGYAYSQGMTPALLSAAMAGTAFTGIIGTLLFQPLRHRLGLVPSGIFAFLLDLVFLQLCVVSIFASGTAFLKWPAANSTDITFVNSSAPQPFVIPSNATSNDSGNGGPKFNLSLMLLMIGIVMSRIGLWLVDLVVTQLILETVIERHRGKVNGVQYSLNMFLDLLKFLLVILVPQPEYFGFLIIASFSFIVLGFMVYLTYSCRNGCSDPVSLEEKKEGKEAEKEEETAALTEGNGEESVRA